MNLHPSGTFEERAHAQLARPEVAGAIGHAMDHRAIQRARAFAGTDRAAMQAAGEAIRAHTVANLDRYLERFAEHAEARGTKVFFAANAAEAVGYVRAVLRDHGARLVVKSKSMVSEEIGLNPALEADGLEVVETDLGEYIVQLAHEPPSHITTPAVHMSRAQIRDLFNEVHGTDLPDDPEALTRFGRDVLRERFLAADVGITGVNFAVAEDGSFVIVTNEGNARMCTSLPRVHIALLGMERMVPSHRELSLMLPLLTASAAGQRVTSYFTFVTGPRRPEEPDGPDEVHVVVIDNGRSAILGSRYRSVLHCIRCGACYGACPVFRQVGGHAYGSVYGGPIGAVLTPLLAGLETAGDLAHASSLCIACTEACPVNIPLHEHLLELRREVARDRSPRIERLAFAWWGRLWSSARGYRLSARLARIGQLPLVRGRRIRRAPFPLSRWTRTRDLPAIARESFRERWRRTEGHGP
jgi:L-lactate dehydrogenase complex protein LldF